MQLLVDPSMVFEHGILTEVLECNVIPQEGAPGGCKKIPVKYLDGLLMYPNLIVVELEKHLVSPSFGFYREL